MKTDYLQYSLPNGIKLHFMPTQKFKTISIGLFIHQELNSELAALNALLPSVLEKGCRLYPDYLTLQRKLENLFGADLSTDIIKSGERHTLAFSMETAHDRYLGENSNLLRESLAILSAVLTDPLLENGAFSEKYVKQEKSQLVKDIKALLNDKATYATERCLAEMCTGERFGVFRLGKIEDYDKINPTELYQYYKQLLACNPVDIYVVGDLNKQEVLDAVGRFFNFSRDKKEINLPATEQKAARTEVLSLEEQMSVNQAKLVLGYRTAIGFKDELHCALLVYSGILGGFPHSKLFMKVREEAGLAYYIHSRLERHKGLMLIAAGINYADQQQARAIIELQLSDLTEGKISDTELENTKRGLVNQLLSRQDSPSQMISFHLDGKIGGYNYSFEQLIEGIEKVSLTEITTVAERIKLDTTFLLRPAEGGEQSDD
ncbi:MAG: insulinase family protein [Firmicutes bacterium]|nr:insulinase family protein [Bacillota bacterium]